MIDRPRGNNLGRGGRLGPGSPRGCPTSPLIRKQGAVMPLGDRGRTRAQGGAALPPPEPHATEQHARHLSHMLWSEARAPWDPRTCAHARPRPLTSRDGQPTRPPYHRDGSRCRRWSLCPAAAADDIAAAGDSVAVTGGGGGGAASEPCGDAAPADGADGVRLGERLLSTDSPLCRPSPTDLCPPVESPRPAPRHRGAQSAIGRSSLLWNRKSCST